MRKTDFRARVLGWWAILVLAIGLGAGSAAAEPLRLATTTSADATGLLDALAPVLAREIGVDLQWVAVGTGKALRIAGDCNADVVLVHAPDAEARWIAEGFGKDRREVFYNDFVLVGPKEDPLGLRGGSDIVAAFSKLAAGQGVFVSRGDQSGTHMKENALWQKAGVQDPTARMQYLSAGQGMMGTLRLAAERRGYTLVDRATWITFMAKDGAQSGLEEMVAGDPLLRNQYSIILVNADRCPNVHEAAARRFQDWIASERGQQFVGDFRIHGKKLFVPNAH
jgi:tungstate transport system substrate-binding protein